MHSLTQHSRQRGRMPKQPFQPFRVSSHYHIGCPVPESSRFVRFMFRVTTMLYVWGQPKGPHQSMGVLNPNSRGHITAWESLALLLHCMRTACTYWETQPRSPATYLLARHNNKVHKTTMKLPSNWYSNVPMKKPLSLVR